MTQNLYRRLPTVLVGLAVLINLLPVVWVLAGVAVPTGMRGASAILTDRLLWSRLGTTLGISVAALTLIFPTALLQAWIFFRSDLPGRRVLLILSTMPLFLPPLVHVLSWFGVLGWSGWWAIVWVYTISFGPLVMLLAGRGLGTVDVAQVETLRLTGGWFAVLADDFRRALPGALAGSALALCFMLADFAVADFLTGRGPKVTVYADYLYAHLLGGRVTGVAVAAFPGLILGTGLLAWALRMRDRMGIGVGACFAPAPPVPLGRWVWLLGAVAWALVFRDALFPLLSLAWQVGSWSLFAETVVLARTRVFHTVLLGVLTATLLVVMALPLAWYAQRQRRPWLLELALFLPLATPPLLYGVGLTRLWNRPLLDMVYQGLGLAVIALAGRYLAFALLPLGNAISRIDPALFEAARLAGASPIAQARRLLWPLLWPPVGTAWAISFCFTLRELDILIMLRASNDVLLYQLYASVIFEPPPRLAALALLLMLLTAVPLTGFLLALRNRDLHLL